MSIGVFGALGGSGGGEILQLVTPTICVEMVALVADVIVVGVAIFFRALTVDNRKRERERMF